MSGKSKILMTVLLTFSVTCLIFVFIFSSLGVKVGGGRFGRLEAVSRIIDDLYIGDFDEEEAEDAAIEAVLSTIGDPYSEYYDRQSTADLMNNINGSYEGVGIEILANSQTGELLVLTVYKDGPAYRAGMKSGDVLVSIDGVNYTAENIDSATAYMKGENVGDKDKEMTLTVRRGEELIDFKLKRGQVDMYGLVQKDLGEGVTYLRFNGFYAESAKKIADIVNGLDENTKGIVVDLRENSGGDLDAAVDICDLFLDDGLIMYTEDKAGNRTDEYAKKGACHLPMVILVDGGTASASEVMAGCMQARDRAVIIGEKTYGKGVSQLVCSIGNNNADGILKVTTYKNYRPDGIWLNEGVTPDIEAASAPAYDEYGDIVFDAEGEDIPLKLALEELRKKL